jgi:hypothetical protein
MRGILLRMRGLVRSYVTFAYNLAKLRIISQCLEQCIYGFRIIIRKKNCDYFPKRHQPLALITETQCVFYAAGCNFNII